MLKIICKTDKDYLREVVRKSFFSDPILQERGKFNVERYFMVALVDENQRYVVSRDLWSLS